MEEQLISDKTAKLAKEKGFNIETFYALIKSNSGKEIKMFYNTEDIHPLLTFISWLPTQSLLQQWIRKIHNINITVTQEVHMKWFYDFSTIALTPETYDAPDYIHEYEEGFSSYEDALEAALFAILQLL
jgi:hypothetical protein